MITLKTLSEATEQEVFDQVAKHLLTQKTKSVVCPESNNNCKYRGYDGLKCAAGCLIADDEYNPLMEGQNWRGLVDKGYVDNQHTILIQELQNTHDLHRVCTWESELKLIAERFGLKFNREKHYETSS